MSNKSGFRTIDEYIAMYPDDVQARLETLRATIKAAAPDATEKISYQMPAFDQKGTIINFAAWKKHIALYPIHDVGLPAHLAEQAASYERTKGSIHFPHDKPLPLELITEMVKISVANNLRSAEAKEKLGKKKAK